MKKKYEPKNSVMKKSFTLILSISLLLIMIVGCEKEECWSINDLTDQYKGVQTSFVPGNIPEKTNPITKTFYVDNNELRINVSDSPKVIASTTAVTKEGYNCTFETPSDAFCIIYDEYANCYDTIFHKKLLAYQGRGLIKGDSIIESGIIIYTDSISETGGSLAKWTSVTKKEGIWSSKLKR